MTDWLTIAARVPGAFGGVQIIVSDAALKETDERLFPESKNRSRRIRKKLIKRFGGEFRKVPCIYRIGDKLVAHPERYCELERQLDAQPCGQHAKTGGY